MVLCKYLLICPDRAGEDNDLVTYKDFKDAAPYVGGFKNTAEKPIARHLGKSLYLCMIIFLLPFPVHAHGVKGRVDAGGVVVSAEYDSGEPMSYARVKVSAPAAKLTFQSGRTDRNGRFCFFPDMSGEWKVVVDDEMGHRLEIPVTVNEAMELKTDQQAERSAGGSLSKYERASMGISIIFGFSGLFFWRKRKKDI